LKALSNHKVPKWLPLIGQSQWLLFLAIIIVLFSAFQSTLWPGGVGFKEDESISNTTTVTEEEKQSDAAASTTKTTTTSEIKTTKQQSGKTLWDWLQLIGAPLSLAILGVWLQRLQSQRDRIAEKHRQDDIQRAAKQEAARIEEIAKEEALQIYFDRLSYLLIEQNIFALSVKERLKDKLKDEDELFEVIEWETLLESAKNIIRARTLSILRRLEGDGLRKSSVIHFLNDADIIQGLNIELHECDLSGADLKGIIFRNTFFQKANLSKTDLRYADLSDANLLNVDFQHADLSVTSLQNADLSFADLRGAVLADEMHPDLGQ
jgi:uncharacterized protein YjbI with pentapeptide repeats